MWVSIVKAKGQKYAYATVYESSNARGEKNIQSLGRVEEAPLLLRKWKNAPDTIPGALKHHGLNPDKIQTWIKRLDQQVSKVI